MAHGPKKDSHGDPVAVPREKAAADRASSSRLSEQTLRVRKKAEALRRKNAHKGRQLEMKLKEAGHGEKF